MPPVTRYHAQHALLPTGWADDVLLEVAADGEILALSAGTPATDATSLGRFVIPGMPNLHSHAFQRVMAGHAEHASGVSADNFWTWREAMYALAARVSPESLYAIAAQLYSEMLRGGYTAVCEFHYVHHRTDGAPYQPATAMSDALIAAARDSGIGLTLLPVLYQSGGFDGRPLSARQRRFGNSVDEFAALVDTLRAQQDPQLTVGIALHSLRAVPPPAMREVLEAEVARSGPIHIHIAEQLAEVDECLRERGARPLAWLLDHAQVDPRWCMVHATHLCAEELRRLGATGAVAGLCPTTEANLGDGLFALREWLDLGGAIGVGSDSQVSVSAVEELRWLEYGQRLRHLRRNIIVDRDNRHSGQALWRECLVGGAQASGRNIGGLAVGLRADLIVLADQCIEFARADDSIALDVAIFAGNRNLVRDVMVGGRWCVRDGQHVRAAQWEAGFRSALSKLGGE